MHAMSQAGCPVTVLSVTDGEAAYPDWPELRAVRARELQAAMQILGGPQIHIRRLQLPDGRISSVRSRLRDAVLQLVTPSSLLVAPYERDGHPDHEAVGGVCVDIAVRAGLRLPLTREDARAKTGAMQCFRSQLEPSSGRVPIVPGHVLPYFQRDFEMFAL
jgi:LmbE family N-acetylglucosaminyl deacetylase